MEILKKFKEKAASDVQKIIFAEGEDERIIQAAEIVAKEGTAEIIILGDLTEIRNIAAKKKIDLEGLEIIDPKESEYIEEFSNEFYEMRKHKGINKEDAKKIIQDPLYFGTMMIYKNRAAGMVAGAANPTGNVLRPAFQIIKTKKGISTVSSAIIVLLKDKDFGENGIITFADCAVNPTPNSEQLAEIAQSTAETVEDLLSFEAKIAMLSFSTMGSARHENVTNVQEAVEIAHNKFPDLKVDGELQADAALVESVGVRKAPDSEIAGEANVLVFPDLQSSNIGVKLAQRLANSESIGPILQGLAAPINDLSRGCSVEEIVNLTAITAIQAQNH
ncbi:Phosphate acetyltransferase [Halanaerobium saccharolyticum subsp. saccharolyticum DSM 6643]|uniref:Phosphate acetyltransferase n=1 Tax=Halanaerobium saccharolyticum subsp. saccharolyticum DSM 6643 TaxID=1293054 RepID=M5E0A0_9FIRM|nr:phosphate acetyltransferase [Halanaerobium saccharolyticum]CCU78971.1 Phosphate acetyltransferase [Halanaerobium saccharolyticum subsp. saccharolyticum DSM 6643]